MSQRPIVECSEYQTKVPSQQSDFGAFTRVEVDPALTKLKLNSDDKELLTKSLKGIIGISGLKDGLAITAFNFVGIANFSEFTVVVKPKILMKSENLFGMINYAYAPQGWESIPQFSPETDKNFLIDIIIGTFVKQCEVLLKQGIYKSYVTYQANIPYLRSKLILKQQLHNVLKNTPKFFCEFDELEYNNLENQIILFCLRRSYSLTENEELRKRIRMLIIQLTSVIQDKFITMDDFKKLNYSRQNIHYQNIHALCKLIIKSSGIVDFYSYRKHLVHAFFVSMNEIFEEFVAKLFKEFCSEKYNVESQKKKKAWNIDEKKFKTIRTDILLRNIKTGRKTVIDTKYKDDITDGDLYQIGFYIHEYKSRDEESIEKRGYAVLPTTKELLSEEQHSVISSVTQKVSIVKSYLNIGQAVDLLYRKDEDSRMKLKRLVYSLIPE